MRSDDILGLLPRLWYGIDGHPGVRLFALELLFWTIVIVLTIALVRFRPGLLEKTELRLRQISRHTRFWLVGFGLIVILLRVGLLPWIPVPLPAIHDEFSYLLASDTFAHGRLTNPPSPMWVHFESFHINVQPTYQSMYPPAQGLALALGQKLTGVPWFGVLLSIALMCSAIYWMLLGWLPPPWAWLGGTLACIRFGIFSYWVNSYLGGAVAALGGALVVGALPRLRMRLTVQTALLFAAGLLILANSRPLEGLLFSLPIIVSVAILTIQSATLNWRGTVKIVFPALALLAVGAAWMLYYNWRGTGDPLLMPYAANFKMYHIAPPFFFQRPNPIPSYHHQSMRAFYVLSELLSSMLSKDFAADFARRAVNVYYAFFIWPFMLLIAPALYAMWHSKMRVVVLSVTLLAVGLLAQIWPPFPHYAAPATGAVFLLLLYSLRHFTLSESHYAVVGVRVAVVVFAVWMISPIAERMRDPFVIGSRLEATPMPSQFQRQRIRSEMEARGGKHLVIVHYSFYDLPLREWVYNEADIQHAPVIWARDMGYLENQELVNFYPDRQPWYVDHGDPIALLLPYDQVTSPLKLAFEYPASQSGWTQGPNVRQGPPSAAPAHSGTPITAVLSP